MARVDHLTGGIYRISIYAPRPVARAQARRSPGNEPGRDRLRPGPGGPLPTSHLRPTALHCTRGCHETAAAFNF
jgi:hypothetical protein